MTEPVRQLVEHWNDWPPDVVDRLRDWNRRYLLSFRVGPDFDCSSCNRRIAGHRYGNAVVRSRRKEKGRKVCESCLITFARAYEIPPGPVRKPTREQRLRNRIHALERRLDRLKGQLRHDQRYIDRLEIAIQEDVLASIQSEMRIRG